MGDRSSSILLQRAFPSCPRFRTLTPCTYIFVRRTFRSNPNSSAATHARVRLSLRHVMVNSGNPMAKAEIKAMATNLPCFVNTGGLPFVTIRGTGRRSAITARRLNDDQETCLQKGKSLLNFFSGKGTIGPCYHQLHEAQNVALQVIRKQFAATSREHPLFRVPHP